MRHEPGELARAEGASCCWGKARATRDEEEVGAIAAAICCCSPRRRGEVPGQDGEPLRHLGRGDGERAVEERREKRERGDEEGGVIGSLSRSSAGTVEQETEESKEK